MQLTNPIEQSLLKEVTTLYASDLLTESHSNQHMDCLACSKRLIIDIITSHQDLIQTRQRTLLVCAES